MTKVCSICGEERDIVNSILRGSTNLTNILNDVNYLIRQVEKLKESMEKQAQELQEFIVGREKRENQ